MLNGTTVEIDGRNATATTVQGWTVVAWTTDGVTHAVVTDLSTDKTITLAEAVS